MEVLLVLILVVVRQLLVMSALVVVDPLVLGLRSANSFVGIVIDEISDRCALGDMDSGLVSLALISRLVAWLYVTIIFIFLLLCLLIPGRSSWLNLLLLYLVSLKGAWFFNSDAELPLCDFNRLNH